MPAIDLHENFIDAEGNAEALVFSLQSPGVYRSKLDTPEADRFAAEGDASFGQEIFDVTVAKVESEIQPDSVTDDIGRESMTFVGIHPRIVSQCELSWQYPKIQSES